MHRIIFCEDSFGSLLCLYITNTRPSGALAVGARGTITGIANVIPRVTIEIFDLFRSGKYDEARELQGRLSSAEWAILNGGIPSIKVS